MSNNRIGRDYLSSTSQLKVLSFLAKFSNNEYHEREIARRTGVSCGSANSVLNELFADGILVRRQAGKMLFYSFNLRDPLSKILKIFVSVSILRPLIKELRKSASEIVLYGSCARGEDGSGSDVDLFIISEEKEKTLATIEGYRFRNGFDHIRIEPVIFSSEELLKSEKVDQEFLSLVREGIILWNETTAEAGIQGMSRPGEDRPFPAWPKARR